MTMRRNPSFTPSPALRKYLDSRIEKYNETGPTARLNELFDRYSTMLHSLKIPLTSDERQMLTTMLHGVHIDTVAIQSLPEDVFDEEFGFDPAAADRLATKLHGASLAQLTATVDSLGY